MPSQLASDALDVALLVAAAIERAGGEYFVGGSIASSLQGEPRATNDIDFVVALPLGRLSEFCQALGDEFEVDLDMLRDAIRTAGSANAFHLPSVTKIDFFGRGYEGYDESEFARRRPVVVRASGATLVVKAPEDTVLRKLLWYRAGGGVSDRQWRDVVSVLRIAGAQLDEGYLNAWAERLNVTDLLTQARTDAGA
ncbi:MAG: hypothetical protein KF718_30765 [Polyangiaceae bacterium]|nr:hypothetical protein [Polyangiaceae bacterium]